MRALELLRHANRSTSQLPHAHTRNGLQALKAPLLVASGPSPPPPVQGSSLGTLLRQQDETVVVSSHNLVYNKIKH